MIDPVALAAELIRRPSVTPQDAGALGVLETALKPLGFECHRLKFDDPAGPPVENLFAKKAIGSGRHFCFAGHTDVVPPGPRENWAQDPFSGTVADGRLYGRGAADMKGAIAAFAAASDRFLAKREFGFEGAISLLITGDEEGVAVNGTKPVLEWMQKKGEKLDACLVGEPTNPTVLGEMAKIGRRGSLTGRLSVYGTQGHVAYPHLAENAVHRMARIIALLTEPLDKGTEHFPASSLQFTTVDVGNPTTNVIPAEARATFNIRFNDTWNPKSLETEIRQRLALGGARYELKVECSGGAFLTPPGPLAEILSNAVQEITGRKPELSTTGGTSDARFIKDFCPVIEFGLTGETMHKIDENVPVADIEKLSRVYERVLERFFA
ncbi:succinyl-diaminopimelate desuccinylase [Dongia sp.]|uniref:succinyl-diaminopimelate desuccinylase n=1 Tax=Dongia sp. TaxID=1977262 RepID=UPI0037512E8B